MKIYKKIVATLVILIGADFVFDVITNFRFTHWTKPIALCFLATASAMLASYALYALWTNEDLP